MPSLARTLVVAALLVLAGCLGPAGAPTATEGPTTTETTSSPPDGRVSLPDGPKERPPHPEELTHETVADYVRTYERRFAYNSLWYGETSDVLLDCEVDDVEERGGNWRVVVSCTGYSNTGGGENGTATATEIHADWGTQTYVYRVGEDGVTREYLDG